jgi:uracil-DNA glycosylase family 4
MPVPVEHSATLSTPPIDRARAIAALQGRVRGCRLCQQHGYIPVAHPITEGRSGDRILLVGQAPGHVSIERNQPFSGLAGRVLDAWLVRAGFPAGSLHERVYLSSLTKCDPGKNPRGGGDRAPSPAEIALCRPYLEAELAILRPDVILLLGGLAIAHFLGKKRLDEAVGRAYTSDDIVFHPLWPGHEGTRLLPLPHSSGVSRWLNSPDHQELLSAALDHLARWRAELDL